MRRVAMVLLLSTGACLGGTTDPTSAVIRISLRDDAGASAGRNQVVLTHETRGSFEATTGRDGDATIVVREPGVYRITVVPRAGLVADQSARSRTVTVGAGDRRSYRFTLYREGWAPAPESDG